MKLSSTRNVNSQSTPENELLASHLFRVAIELPRFQDPTDLVPSKLRECESVLLLRTLFLRNKEVRPLWWEVASNASKSFPNNKTLALFAAEAVIDRNIFANLDPGRLTVGEPHWPEINQSLAVLEEHWERIRTSENAEFEEGLSILSSQMIAKRILGDRDGAVRIARELIGRSTNEKIVTNAVGIAITFDDSDLAEAGLAKLPVSGRSEFYRGMFIFNRGEWGKAAEHFKGADCLQEESALVAAIIRLAPAADPQSNVGSDELEERGSDDGGDPRVPTILAQLARRRGFADLAKRSFDRALAMLGPDSSMPARIMIASLAQDMGEYGRVVDVLDGHVSTAVLSIELQWLADAHASEAPRKTRNLRFFEALAGDVRQSTGMKRAYATVLLDMGRYADAEQLFKQVVADGPDDVYSHLRLVEAMRRQKNEEAAQSLIRGSKERLFLDQPLHGMAWAVNLRDAGEPTRAIKLAYDLVRRHPASPRTALGYIGLIIGSNDAELIPDPKVCDVDCAVILTSDRGERHTFIIDDGGPVLGMRSVPRNSERAARVLGSSKGAELAEEGPQGQKHVWKLAELKSKYLHVLHTLMNEFPIRFPGAGGLWRVDVAEGDVKPILDMVRDRAESSRAAVLDLYVNKKLPLALVGKALGENELWLAQYVRELGLNIETCVGVKEEVHSGIDIMNAGRGTSAVLDTYTAVTCAEMGLLENMKSWFGTLTILKGTIDRIDNLIAAETKRPDREAMALWWRDGQIVRVVKDDDFVKHQIAALSS